MNCLDRQVEDDKDGDLEMIEAQGCHLDVESIEMVDAEEFQLYPFKDRVEIAMQPGSKFFDSYVIGPNEVGA